MQRGAAARHHHVLSSTIGLPDLHGDYGGTLGLPANSTVLMRAWVMADALRHDVQNAAGRVEH